MGEEQGLSQVHLELIKMVCRHSRVLLNGAQLKYFASLRCICIIFGLYLKPCSFRAKGESRPVVLAGITRDVPFLFLISVEGMITEACLILSAILVEAFKARAAVLKPHF